MSEKKSSSLKISVKKGIKYSFCTCGVSKSLPYCDNQHRSFNLENNTNYKSIKIISESDTELEISSSIWNS